MRQKFTFLKKRKKKIYKKIAFRAFNTHATEKFLKTKIIEIVLKTNEQIEQIEQMNELMSLSELPLQHFS